MVFITGFQRLEKSEKGFPDFGTQRTFGYYADWDSGVETMHTNNCDIREYLYNYGVLEEIGEGIYRQSTKREFFKWDEDKEGFYEIEEPEFVKHWTNFSIG